MSAAPAGSAPPSVGGVRLRIGWILDVTLPIYASVVFVGLWLYVVLAAFTDSSLPAQTWAWLQGLDTILAVVAWLAILPIAVFLWAWQADLEALYFALVVVALAGWTFIAWSGSLRAIRRRWRSRSAG